MNGFDLPLLNGYPQGNHVYQYINPATSCRTGRLAKQYVLGDEMFQTQGSGSFTAHQDLIRGGTAINDSQSEIDFPWNQQNRFGNWDATILPDNHGVDHDTVEISFGRAEPRLYASRTVSVFHLQNAARLARREVH